MTSPIVIPNDATPGVRKALRDIALRLNDVSVSLIELRTVGITNVVAAGSANGTVFVQTPGGSRAISVDAFSDLLRNTRLYSELLQKIDDPTRFDFLGERVKALLLPDITLIAESRGAEIARRELTFQSTTESFAAQVTEVTAAIQGAAAGVRQTIFAEANNLRAAAGAVTQVSARLDDFGGSAATVESVMTAVADRATGLEAQYVLKVNAGGAYAAIGLAATESLAGDDDSAIIMVADRLAFVASGDTVGTGVGEIDPSDPGSSRLVFGCDASGVYIRGGLRVNADGPTLADLASGTGLSIAFTSEFFKVDNTGAAVNTSVTLTANLTGGLSGDVTWSHGTGYGGSTPSGINTWVVDASDQSIDAVTYSAEITIDGTTYDDSVTIVRLRDGSDTLNAVLTNEFQGLPANADGSGTDYSGATGTLQVYKGATRMATGVTYSYVSNVGFSSAPSSSIDSSTGVYTISSGLSGDSGTVTYRATIDATSETLDRVFSLAKTKSGAPGSPGATAKLLSLGATSLVFQVDRAGVASPTSITFSAVGQNLSGSPTISVTAGTATLGGSGGTRTLAYSDLTTTTATIEVGQDGLTDTVTVVKLFVGSDTINVVLPNQSHTVPASNAGVVSSFAGSGTTIQVYEGATVLGYTTGSLTAGHYNISTAISPSGKLTLGAITGNGTNIATVANATAMDSATDTVTVTFTITGNRADGSSFSTSAVQTITKSKDGAVGGTGPAAVTYKVSSPDGVIKKSAAGVYSPTTITFSGSSVTGANTSVAYSGRFIISTSTNGTVFTDQYTSSADEASKTYTVPSAIVALRVRLYLAGGTSTLLDEAIVPIIIDGLDSNTVVMNNGSHTVPTDSSGIVTSYTGSGTTIQVYDGTTLATFHTVAAVGRFLIGTPVVSPSGKITVGAITGSGTTTATVAVHSAMDSATDTVTITYPITLRKANGTDVTLSAVQTITKAKAGARGYTNVSGLQYGIRATGSVWVDNQANRVVNNLVNSEALTTDYATTTQNRFGDQVTMVNGAPWTAVNGVLTYTTTAWSSSTNYAIGSYVTRSAGTYRAKLASGPANGGAQDPTSAPTYWLQVYPQTTWRAETDYTKNALVIQTTATTTILYKALKASGPSGVGAQDPGTTSGYWLALGAATNKTSWANSTVYHQFDYFTNSGAVYTTTWPLHTSIASPLLFVDEQATQDFADTRYWTGTGWSKPGIIFNGEVLMPGSVTIEKLFVNYLSGITALLGNVTIDASGSIKGGKTSYADTAAGFFLGYDSTTYKFKVGDASSSIDWNGSALAIKGTFKAGPSDEFQVDSSGNVTCNKFFGYCSNFGNTYNPALPCITATGYATTTALIGSFSNPSSSSTAHAARLQNTHFSTSIILGTAFAGRAAYAESGTYQPFTGSHEGLMPAGTQISPGDIVVDVRRVGASGWSDSIFEVAYSTRARQRGAIGVLTNNHGPLSGHQPNAMVEGVTHTTDEDGNDIRMTIMSGAYYEMADSYEIVTFNAVGEGLMNICGMGGNLEPGDFICSSELPGKGMKQADDGVRSYTVAKSRERVVFSHPTEVKVVAIIYVCG